MGRITILGCGSPTPTADRFGSSYLVNVGSEYLLFDCGPATTHKLVKAGYLPTQVSHLFFTHHHFDHDVDYPCFLLTRWDQGAGQEAELQVWGPSPTRRITELLIGEEGAFAFDWKARVQHPLSLYVYTQRGGKLPRRPPTVRVRDVVPGPVTRGGAWEVRAAPAEHVQPYLDSLAYRIDSSEGSIVVTGDTRPCRSVVELAREADVLLHMCIHPQQRMNGTPLADTMTGTTEAARVAKEARVKKLVLVHIGHVLAREEEKERGMDEIGEIYDGEIVFGDELGEVLF